MFSPADADLERGWPGRIEGDTVVQLAAQTLQAFFTGGSSAREHAEYALDSVLLRAPVLEPLAHHRESRRSRLKDPSSRQPPAQLLQRSQAAC